MFLSCVSDQDKPVANLSTWLITSTIIHSQMFDACTHV